MLRASRLAHKRKIPKKKIYLKIIIMHLKPLLSLTTISLSVLMPRVHHQKETSPAMKKVGPLKEPVLCELRKNALMRLLRLNFRISNILRHQALKL
jgi:hypothetical protein